MSLIHDQNRGAALVGPLHQQIIQCKQDLGFRVPGAPQIQIVGHHFEELIDAEPGIEKRSEGDPLAGQKVAQALQHSRFAGTYFA